ncbi:NTP transferase domain-containing protein [Candidatus Berkelbacteria bacterium]|nr:NTP transferase domain-containing protein [Candidatus Berkelbacteria bacterium]
MTRQRLTITLEQEILKKLDEVVDKKQIRNRSHAIEFLLSQSLSPQISRALILAGGKGTRLRPFTYELPTALILLHGRPLLEHILEQLSAAGLKEVKIAIGHLKEKIKEHFKNHHFAGMTVGFLEEDEPLGTGGPLKNVGFNTPFLVLNGDVLAQIDFSDMIRFHQSHQGVATLAITAVSDPFGFGTIRMHGTQIVDFAEKPAKEPSVSRLINAGIYVFNPSIKDYLPPQGVFSLERDIFPHLAKEDKLFGYVFEGKWFNIGGDPGNYHRALKEWGE